MKEEVIQQRVTGFLDKYFEEEIKVAEYELDFLDTNKLANPTDVNYLKLKRFMFTAYNNLKDMDAKIGEGLVAKMFRDINNLVNFYGNFLKKIKIPNLVYERDFLSSVKEYVKLEEEKELTQAKVSRYKQVARSTQNELDEIKEKNLKVEIEKVKLLKRRNVDALYNMGKSKEHLTLVVKELKELEEQMRDVFFKHFKEYSDDLKDSFRYIINTMFYCFERVMWMHAQKAAGVRSFFEKANIKGEYCTKTYLEYYLKNIDVTKTSNEGWHQYLQSILRILK